MSESKLPKHSKPCNNCGSFYYEDDYLMNAEGKRQCQPCAQRTQKVVRSTRKYSELTFNKSAPEPGKKFVPPKGYYDMPKRSQACSVCNATRYWTYKKNDSGSRTCQACLK